MLAISAAEPSRRTVVAGLAALATTRPATAARSALTPEQFGAKGDGNTNDTSAFARLSAAIALQGGGTIHLRPVVYVVGEQRRGQGGAAWGPSPILAFDGLPNSLTILGGGATLRCAPGLRYGSFDGVTDMPHRHTMPFIDPTTQASPYHYMISVQRGLGPVEISDLELDGNLQSLRLGSHYGDVGTQIAGSGILLRDNRHDETLRDLFLHHHPQDGLIIDGLSAGATPRQRRVAERVRCEDNGRQGCSLIGGHNWRFDTCAFKRSGRNAIASPPGAGFDMEAEGGKTVRGIEFEACIFSDNLGAGFVADSGDSADASFFRCRFIGTVSTALWPNKPALRFTECQIVGTMVRCFGDSDPLRATHFTRCVFTDARSASPTGVVYRQGRTDGSLADLSDELNILFDQCRFIASAGATLPWSTRAIYRDCAMEQRTSSPGYPRGRFIGRNTISGHVDLYGSVIHGDVILNGKLLDRTRP